MLESMISFSPHIYTNIFEPNSHNKICFFIYYTIWSLFISKDWRLWFLAWLVWSFFRDYISALSSTGNQNDIQLSWSRILKQKNRLSRVYILVYSWRLQSHQLHSKWTTLKESTNQLINLSSFWKLSVCWQICQVTSF